jgi:GTP-binding protein
MLIKEPKFEISVMNESQYPKNGIPEIVLVGKSNVGKSSFVNAMIDRKSLARTSSNPGKTRQLNFYNMDNLFYFVDLPGYGYSEMSKAEQQKVAESIEKYLFTRSQIALIIMLIDIRHKPGVNDLTMLDFIKQTNRNFIVIASKADKIAKTKVNQYAEDIALELNIDKNLVIPFSSESKLNKEEIWKEIEKFI